MGCSLTEMFPSPRSCRLGGRDVMACCPTLGDFAGLARLGEALCFGSGVTAPFLPKNSLLDVWESVKPGGTSEQELIVSALSCQPGIELAIAISVLPHTPQLTVEDIQSMASKVCSDELDQFMSIFWAVPIRDQIFRAIDPESWGLRHGSARSNKQGFGWGDVAKALVKEYGFSFKDIGDLHLSTIRSLLSDEEDYSVGIDKFSSMEEFAKFVDRQKTAWTKDINP